jgi:hypothetical protein
MPENFVRMRNTEANPHNFQPPALLSLAAPAAKISQALCQKRSRAGNVLRF